MINNRFTCSECQYHKRKNFFELLKTFFSDSEFKCLLKYKGLEDKDTPGIIPPLFGYTKRPIECYRNNDKRIKLVKIRTFEWKNK